MERSDGTLLDGRVIYAQPRSGFRTGIEPVLLAASIPAQPGDIVIEGGCGSGAALLCLAARVADVHGIGVELDDGLAETARENVKANQFEGLSIVTGDLLDVELPRGDHALANPPYHLAGGTAPTDEARAFAKHGEPGTIGAWIRALAAPLRRHGTLTLILTAAAVPEALAGFAASDCAGSVLTPLWPKAGKPAKLVLLRGIKQGRTPLQIRPGLILHREDGGYTVEADEVLRGGAGLAS